MRAWVGITDKDWFRFLRQRPDLDEVNFWQPGGNRQFKILQPGEPFLFKLHSPHDSIVGGGFFTHSALLPINLAWDAFGEKNGTGSLEELRAGIEKRRPDPANPVKDYQIGCILLQFPFFFEEQDWIPAPSDWDRHIQQGKSYDLESGIGREIWEKVLALLRAGRARAGADAVQTAEARRYGTPYLASARLGQGSFRLLVLDQYQRRCAVTREPTLPVLHTALIRPNSKGGELRLDNGLLLRQDLHTLFDLGYVTVTPNYRFAVSPRIRQEYGNGSDYDELSDRPIFLPDDELLRPNRRFLEWHNQTVFKS